MKRCSQNSQLKGLSPVWVRLCLSRLAVGTRQGLSRGGSAAGPRPGPGRGGARLTLGAEGLPAEVALEGLLACVRAQVHVEIGLLGEGVAAELTDVRPLVPVRVGDTDRAITKGSSPLRSATAGSVPGPGAKETIAAEAQHLTRGTRPRLRPAVRKEA